MRLLFLVCVAAACLSVPARALELPEELIDVLPQEAAELSDEQNILSKGIQQLWVKLLSTMREAVADSLHGAAAIALVVLLTGAAECMHSAVGGVTARFTSLAGVLGVAVLSAGSLTSLIGLGMTTIQDISDLTKLLLPTMAAAMAGCGGVFTASAWQVGTLFAADALSGVMRGLLLPLVYCHIALATAGAALPEVGLEGVANALKKMISWVLCGMLTAFTFYLSISGVLTGSADRAAVKTAQAAISGAVPIVGGILAESAEAVLGAAHSLRAVTGVIGIFGVLFLCLTPLLRLGVQFLLYRTVAFISAVSGNKTLERLLEQLGDAFALVFGMTAACALLLLVSILVSVSIVVM